MWGMIFPGQGSQHPGMGRFLYDNFREAKQLFEEASDTLHKNMTELLFEGSEEDLKLTANTQPALLLVSAAGFRVLKSLIDFAPKAMSGHSVGEYAAAVAAEAMTFSDAVRAVRLRGEAMQEAVPVGEGGMCAVMGLSEEQIVHLCQWAEKESGLSPLEPANYNSPGQIVISGKQELIAWLQANFKKDIFNPPPPRAKLIPLKVSAPFHCSMMKPAQDRMEQVLGEMHFSDAQVPVVQNVSAEPVTQGDLLRANLVRQVSAPVLWTQCVRQLKTMGCEKLIECGSGTVLSGLVKKIDPESLVTFNMNSLEELKAVESELTK